MDKQKKWFRKQIDSIRSLEGYTNKQIAERLDVTESYLSRMYNGHKPITAKTVGRLKSNFGILTQEEEEKRITRAKEGQSSYGQVARYLEEHNADLKRNLDDLRKNIEDLRRENEKISNYINHLKTKE